jgi:C4-type Zn-finger protein
MSTILFDCPHCNKSIDKKTMADNRKYRSEAGIDIFACHHCNGHFKFDPVEYLQAKKSGDKVKLYKVNELLKSEKRAGFKSEDDSMFDWKGYPIRVAIGIALFAVIIIFLD